MPGGARQIRHRRAAIGRRPSRGAAADETPKPGDAVFARARYTLIASPQQALAAADAALAMGVTPIVLSDRIEGEARDIGLMHAAIALQLRAGGFASAPIRCGCRRCCCRAARRRSQCAAKGAAGATASSCCRSPRARRRTAARRDRGDRVRHGRDRWNRRQCRSDLLARQHRARRAIGAFPSRRRWPRTTPMDFFDALGDLIVTGPTLTNVNDFRAILVLPQPAG
jgi:glycerate 2-kinase